MTNLTSDEQSRQKKKAKCKSIHHTNDKKSQQRENLLRQLKTICIVKTG